MTNYRKKYLLGTTIINLSVCLAMAASAIAYYYYGNFGFYICGFIVAIIIGIVRGISFDEKK